MPCAALAAYARSATKDKEGAGDKPGYVLNGPRVARSHGLADIS
jgi:hypothetical protein